MNMRTTDQTALPTAPPHPPPDAPAQPRSLPIRQIWDSAGMLLVFAALFGGCALFVPDFRSATNMISLGLSITTVGIIACTMLFCLAAGDFDLSVGSVLAMAGVLCVVVVNATGSVTLGAVAGVLAGAAVGLVNGVVIAQLGVNALIATLAMMQIVRGLCFMISGGSAIGVANVDFYALGNSSLFDVPTPMWIMVGCFVVFGLLLHKTVFGRNTLAIGGNREAARLAGIAVTRTKIIIFTMQGLIAAFAGVIEASQMTSGQPNSGQGLELRVISACVLGGVSLTGGVGTILSVIVGALIMGTVQNAMDLMSVPTFYQYVASGGILLAAVLLDRVKQWTSI
jgi:L-arabinose transport system permease protein